jgi:hypothetical protein
MSILTVRRRASAQKSGGSASHVIAEHKSNG